MESVGVGEGAVTIMSDREGRLLTAAEPTLGERYPWLRVLLAQPVDVLGAVLPDRLPSRVVGAFARGGIRTCADLEGLTETDLHDIRGTGPTTVGLVMAALDDVGARLRTVNSADTQPRTADSEGVAAVAALLNTLAPAADLLSDVREALDVLCDWADFNGHGTAVGGILDSLAGTGSVPADVARAADAVRGLRLGAPPGSEASPMRVWWESLDGRERDVVRHRIARQDRTLEELGQTHGVTRERIRQVEKHIRTSLAQQLERDSWRRVRWQVERLQSVVGAWAPLSAVPDHRPDDDTWRIVLEMSGLVADEDAGVIHRAGSRLPELDELPFYAPEGVVLDVDVALGMLARHGVHDAHHGSALEAIGLHDLGGVWVRWPRSFVERGIALLSVAGTPLTAEQIAAEVGSASVRSVRQRLQDDPRVQRVTRATLGLRSWGQPEYTGVADLMLKTIAQRGGLIPVRELVSYLEETYEVRPLTTMAYTAAPAFVVEAGTIRARGRSEPFVVDSDPSGVHGLTANDDGSVSYLIQVEGELLRGSGRPAPVVLGGLLGLQPGRTLHYVPTAPAGQEILVLSWSRTSHTGPHLGSVRALALQHGAVDGDLLRLTFDPESLTVDHELVLASDKLPAPVL